MKKPEPILIDNEVFSIEDTDCDNKPISFIYISGPQLCLSHDEAAELKDWLDNALKYIDQEYRKNIIAKRNKN